jgi:hypothetical protein
MLGRVRWLPLSGLAFVGCFALAAAVYGSCAGSDPSRIVAYYASRADRMRQIGGFAALLAGCVFLLVYVAALRDAVRIEPLTTVVLASGVGATMLLAAANGLWAASAFTAELESGTERIPRLTY